jgi:hypothetical protein
MQRRVILLHNEGPGPECNVISEICAVEVIAKHVPMVCLHHKETGDEHTFAGQGIKEISLPSGHYVAKSLFGQATVYVHT